MRKIVWGGLGALLGYLLLWPIDIEPAAWQPPALPDDDPRFQKNEALSSLERIAISHGIGPEAVNMDAQGRLLTGFDDGRIMRFDSGGGQPEVLVNTQGRPLGLDFASNGDLIVADAVHGLIRVSESGGWKVVVDQVADIKLGFADDVVVSADDTAYYTDASIKYGVHQVMEDFFEHRPNGRVIATDLKTGESRVLMPRMYFPNGVTLGPNEDYLLINETARYRVWRYWLRGERAGESEIFIDNLPGLPDNISFNGRDTFWLALYAPRSPQLDALLPWPFVREMIWRLPALLLPGPAKHGFALGLDAEGQVRYNLQDGSATAYAPITSVRESGRYLYFGSLSEASLARLPLAALPAEISNP